MTLANKRRIGLVLALLIALAAAGGAYYWLRPRPPQLPPVELAGLDPAVARAIEAAQENVRSSPRSPQAWGELGIVLFAHSLLPESLPCFEEAERLDAGDARWPYYQALIHIIGDVERALACLDRSIERNPNDIAPRVRRAETLMSLERWDEARLAFEDVQRRRPKNPRAALGLGMLAVRTGDWDRGVTLLTPLLDDPSCRRAARGVLAEIAARRGDPSAAAVQRTVIEDLPKDLPWEDPYLEAVQMRQVGLFQLLDRANILIGRRQYEEAAELLDSIVRTDPNSDEAHLNLGRLYLATNDLTRAEEATQRALAISPKMPAAQFLLGAIRFQKGNLPGAETAFRAAIVVQPDHATAHFAIGECQRKRDDARGAIAAYQQALRYRPNMVEAHMALASALLATGDAKSAREHVQSALRLKPDDAEAKRLMKTIEGK